MRISKTLAREIVDETRHAGRGLLEGGVAVCEYVSRRYQEELTIAHGARLAALIADVRNENTAQFKRVELLRALEDNIWDTIVVAIPTEPRGGTTQFIEKHVIPNMTGMAMNRRCVLLAIYNENLESDPDDQRTAECTFGPDGKLVLPGKLECSECGQEFVREDDGTTHHVKADGSTDYDADEHHVPFENPETV